MIGFTRSLFLKQRQNLPWKRPFGDFRISYGVKVYMTDFFLFARLNLPNVLISVAKKIFDSDFPSPCFDVPKASNFTSGEVQNRDTKNRRLGTIVTSIQDSKPREKQISQSFSYCELINLLRNGTIVRCL